MQGRKDFTPKLFYELSLDRLVPKEDFYRKVNQYLDLHFLYKATEKYYGSEGQQSIDPVVFFKILLVGYLNNINSDRALLRYCSDRSEEHTSELQSRGHLVCRLLLEKKKKKI